MSDNHDTDFSTDTYQDHPEPDAPQQTPRRLDSAADVLIVAMRLAQDTDIV